jgi:hypothetical protein
VWVRLLVSSPVGDPIRTSLDATDSPRRETGPRLTPRSGGPVYRQFELASEPTAPGLDTDYSYTI